VGSLSPIRVSDTTIRRRRRILKDGEEEREEDEEELEEGEKAEEVYSASPYHSTPGRVHKNGLARTQIADLEEENVGGDVVHEEGGAILESHPGRHLVDELCRDAHGLGPGAIIGHSDNSVTDLEQVSHVAR